MEVFNSFVRDLNDLNTFNDFIDIGIVQRRYSYAKLASIPKIPKKRFNPMVECSDYEFKQKYRFTKENMNKIIEIIRDDLEMERPAGNNHKGTSNQVPVEMQVLIAIRRWGLDELPELLANAHYISAHTLEKICRRVAAAISSKASRYIRMPATLAEKEKVTKNFHAIAEFPQVIGAVSCQSFRLRKIIKSHQIFCKTSNCECCINVQITSDASLKIRDFDYKLRPLRKLFCNTQQIFPETRIKERFEQNEFRGRLLLGDNAYTCTNYLYTPVVLQSNASLKEVSFNKSHNATHAPVKLCQQLLQKRFSILQGELVCSSFNSAKHLIVALAVLHNIAIDLDDSYSEFTDDFGLCHFTANVAKYFSSHEDIPEESGVESRSSFISKYF